jgi:hypothetical protein
MADGTISSDKAQPIAGIAAKTAGLNTAARYVS